MRYRDLTHSPCLEVGDRLFKLGTGIHNKWSIMSDRLADRLATQENHLRITDTRVDQFKEVTLTKDR